MSGRAVVGRAWAGMAWEQRVFAEGAPRDVAELRARFHVR